MRARSTELDKPGGPARAAGAAVAPSAQELGAQLCTFLEPARVLTRLIDRVAFSSDASLYRMLPQAVVQPVDIGEVRQLFRYSHEKRIPLTFRSGGTSLSGQAITEGILVDVGRFLRAMRVEGGGRFLRVQPGVIGGQANQALRPYAAKIGPDPASISVARLGGILSNNASGMCCGVAQNAYHTLRSMTFVLPSGTEIDTAAPDAERIFLERDPRLAEGLLELRHRILNNQALSRRIRKKYLTKNTIGYSLNAFLDFETPAAIFTHLLIGAEGTLAFIAEAVLATVPDLPVKSTELLLFRTMHAACAAIASLRAAGAAALELMDRSSLRSMETLPGIPEGIRGLPDAAAALLVEFQWLDQSAARQEAAAAQDAVDALDLLREAFLTSDPGEQEALWKIRKGLFPSVGAMRASGTTVIIEDVAFPVEHLADAALDLRRVLEGHGYHDAVLFGHAKDGNLHFVLAQGFSSTRDIDRYRRLIDDVVHLVVERYDGALKAEHGTGRNMAPFVEREWGREAYAIMQELKNLADPKNLLNPGVILNPDPAAHLAHLKQIPEVEPEIDRCIECGFCEPQCPSRDLTLTPRQRIMVRREIERLKEAGSDRKAIAALNADFPYMVLDTCAVDGLCAVTCPVKIDTGSLTKRFRQLRHGLLAHRAAVAVAHNLWMTEEAGRLALALGHLMEALVGETFLRRMTGGLDAVSRRLLDEPFWQWCAEMPYPQSRPLPASTTAAAAIYFPSCVSRIMGPLPGEDRGSNTMRALVEVAARAGIPIHIPQKVRGNCCGVPFSSKGFDAAHRVALNHTIERFFTWSERGHLPIVVDTSPCTYGLRTARPHLSSENQKRFDSLTILDSIEFVHDRLLPSLPIMRRLRSVVLHPVCSGMKMGTTSRLVRIAQKCSERALVPPDAGCCAFAGDRGLLFPELTAAATRIEGTQATKQEHDGYFSSSRTCEIGMTRATGRVYRSYLHLVDQATRP
jgi:D-lactate dehydrogenase